jgi:hypothetical protein
MEVTKVRLLPRTGRRHQLRVHSMCLGHPIVGDFTYNPVHRDAVLADDAIMAQRDYNMRNTDGRASENMLVGGQQEQSNSNRCDAAGGEPLEGSLGSSDIAERMMLHAHRLRWVIPCVRVGSNVLRTQSILVCVLAPVADSISLFACRINYYDKSGRVPDAAQHPRLAQIIQANFAAGSAPLRYPALDLAAQAPDIFATEQEKSAGGVILQGEAPDPFVFVEGQLTTVL